MDKAERILVIDDDESVRAMIIDALSGEGYEMVEALDGKAGLKSYRDSPAQLVITDLIMPEKEGIETIMELRREFPEVKIIAISGDDSNLQLAEKLGAKVTLSKPFDITDLVEAVRRVLESS